jgi:hypothetical protein
MGDALETNPTSHNLGGLLLLALNTNRSPRYGIQAGDADLSAAHGADSKISIIDAADRRFDGPEQLGVSLQQADIYMHFIIIAGLIHEVAMTRILHVVPVRLFTRGTNDRVSLLFEDSFEFLELPFIHRNPFLPDYRTTEKTINLHQNQLQVNGSSGYKRPSLLLP